MLTISPDFLRTLSLRVDFPNTAKEIVRVLGFESSAQLISAWGGQEWPVPLVCGGSNKAGARRYQRMFDTVGEIASQCLIKEFGGTRLMIPNLKMVIWSQTKDAIRQEFDALTIKDGLSSPEAVFELGIKFGVTGKAVENVLKHL